MRVALSAAALLTLTACAGGNTGRYVDQPAAYEASGSDLRDARGLEISRIGTWSTSGIQEPRRLIIRTDAEWRDFWYDMDVGSAPDVDFDDNMVIAVSSGMRPSTGYSVRVEDVRLDDSGRLRVQIIETEPGRNCATGQQVTHPVDVVVVPRANLRTWSFDDRRVTADC